MLSSPKRSAEDRSLASPELVADAEIDLRRLIDQVEHAGRESARREAALSHAAEGIVIIDPAGHVEFANPTARLFLSSGMLNAAPRLGQPELDRLVAQATASRESVAREVTLWTPAAKPARARAVPLADGSTVLLLSDLSESYRLDRVRRDFVANVSHELKTPVAALRALAETAGTALTSDDLSNAIRFVDQLGVEAARLATLVTDLLDLSRVEAGAELVTSKVELGLLLSDVAERARPVAEERDIELVVRNTDLVVEADASQLGMAVKNLVDNAIRYSERGKVEISAFPNGRWVTISVSDDGIGIPSEEIPRIFERFYRVDKARSRATGGTGLGLAIVRHVTENHGGRVEVSSELGAGSIFTLVLPASPRRTVTEERSL